MEALQCKSGLQFELYLVAKNKNADVTLVTDDKVAFPAHKFVLGACSSVLKDLLSKDPHHYPMIYLNGVKKTGIRLCPTIYLPRKKNNFIIVE